VIDAILPSTVVAVETRCFDSHSLLFPAEQASVTQAVEKRRREFATGRACAHGVLEQLGLLPTAVTSGARGEPQWPPGVVGSITHTGGYCASAAALATEMVTIGIDAEPNASLPPGVPVSSIARAEELAWLYRAGREARGVHLDRLLFSAKESVFKAWFPLTKQELDFEDAAVAFDVRTGTFFARLLVTGPLVSGRPLKGFSGRWMVRDGLLLTAIAIAPEPTYCAPRQ